MDNIVTLFHGGSVEEDEFWNVSFVGMQRVPLIFDDRQLFSELLGSARDELHFNSNDDISVEGVLHYGKSGRILRRLVLIASEAQWDKYVKTVMKNEFQCLDLVVRKLSNNPHGLSLEPENLTPFEPPLPNHEVDLEDVVVVPDAQSAPNEVGACLGVRAECRSDDVAAAPQEIPLTQNHPRGNPDNDGCAPVLPSTTVDPVFIASNSVDVQIVDDEEPYGTARAVDSDDDRPVSPLSEQEMELIRHFCPDRDPLVHEFSDVSHCQRAYGEGRDDELLEAPEADESVEIQKGMLFKDLPTLRRWLQEYSVRRKRPFKVRHSYVERRYTVVCEMSDCNWRVCARKQKATGKFKITKIVGPHTCAPNRFETEASTIDLYPHCQSIVHNFEGSAELEGQDNYGHGSENI